MKEIVLKIQSRSQEPTVMPGLVEACVRRVEGVASARLVEEARLIVTLDGTDAPVKRLILALAKSGYGAELETPIAPEAAPTPAPRRAPVRPFGTQRVEMRVRGMTCASCVAAVEDALRAAPGVQSATVNLATETAEATIDPAKIDKDELFRRVRLSGYEPREPATAAVEAADDARDTARERAWFLAAAAGAAMLMALMRVHASWVGPCSLGIAAAVQIGPGAAFYAGAWRALRARRPDMDVLIALGTTAAFGLSAWQLGRESATPGSAAAMHHGGAYFETAAMLIAFVRLGKLLERRARGRAGAALRELLSLEAPSARRVGPDDVVERVEIRSVRVGDILEVRPGDKIPVDGEVTQGRGAVDEAAVTGEPQPVEKEPGARLFGATINRTGLLRMRALRVGEETLLARIAAIVRAAQADKAPIQRLADRAAAVFVPIVLALSGATLAFWLLFGASRWAPAKDPVALSIELAVSVLVIACPCALGLATPTAILVGSGVGLKRGILVKRAAALEKLARVEVVLFDKTGTLTRGALVASDVIATDGATRAEVLAAAAALEKRSTHPLARAIVALAEKESAALPRDVEDVAEAPGRGVRGLAGGERVRVGSAKLLAEEFIEPSKPLLERVGEHAREGRSVVWVAKGGEAIGAIAFSDEPRIEAARVIAALRERGIDVGIVTGDSRAAAESLAKRLGVQRVEAEVLPDEKAASVERMAAGRASCFVGDGINDAPALATAGVGIAIGGGSDIAKEAGDVVLVRDDLLDVVRAIDLGRATLRKVRQNLFLAFAYNVLAIPLAAGALLPTLGLTLRPEVAGAAMALSSVSVVLNAITLGRVKLK